MTDEIKYMEIDEIFMNHVASCGNPYQEKGSYLNDEIKKQLPETLVTSNPPFPTIYEKSNIFILIGINFKKLSMSFEF